jgi:glycosyltransferase involved in cell wall biosynthesis
MHIVVIIGRFHPYLGGAELLFQQVAEYLMRLGFRVSVLTRKLDSGHLEHENLAGINIYRLPSRKYLFNWAAKRWLRKNHHTINLIVSVRIDKYAPIGAWAKRKYGIHHCSHIITNEFLKMDKVQIGNRARWRRILAGTDLICCLNHDVINFLKGHHVAKTALWHRPNAVDTKAFFPPPLKTAAQETIDVLCCGRLEKQKGSDILIEAWKRLPAELQKNSRLVLAGSGKWNEQIKEAAQGFDNIVFLGNVSREAMPELYRSAQIYTQPSRFEGVSISILEAMASGLPVVTTEITGTVEQVRHGENGLLIPVEAVEGLTDALIELLTDAEKRHRMGAASRRIVEEKYSMDGLLADFAEKYKELSEPR